MTVQWIALKPHRSFEEHLGIQRIGALIQDPKRLFADSHGGTVRDHRSEAQARTFSFESFTAAIRQCCTEQSCNVPADVIYDI